jgi:A/G-specific adenine glycosylase
LPGVGEYVASAVGCFAFGKRAVLLDQTTARISSRLKGRSGPARRWQVRLDLYRLAGESGAEAQFNRALLHLGSTICSTKRPKCLACPVNRHCATFRTRLL